MKGDISKPSALGWFWNMLGRPDTPFIDPAVFEAEDHPYAWVENERMKRQAEARRIRQETMEEA